WDAKFDYLINLVTFEVGLTSAFILLLFGLGLGICALASWDIAGLGELRPTETMRLVIPSATATLMAFQMTYGALFLSILELRAPRPIKIPQSNNQFGSDSVAGTAVGLREAG